MSGNDNVMGTEIVRGRFAPSPTGRMHLGNIFAALMSWLSVRSRKGQWILRIEDLDPQRSRPEYARLIEDDLAWLGLDWDEGGMDGRGQCGPYCQSLRSELYEHYLEVLNGSGLTYPCTCTRADIMASSAPHQSDGRVIYAGKCRPASMPAYNSFRNAGSRYATRIYVPVESITFTDGVFGPQSVNLARECGDFVLRRADGAWAYQLAVVVDDALMGVTEVVRGCDLLLSAAQQIYLYRILGFEPPRYIHLPLLCNAAGQRLSKRDFSMSMVELRQRYTPAEITGYLAHAAGLIPEAAPCSPTELAATFSAAKIPSRPAIVVNIPDIPKV